MVNKYTLTKSEIKKAEERLKKMTVVHKVCNAEVKSSGKGDWGICTKYNKRVDHLVTIDGVHPEFSSEVIIK